MDTTMGRPSRATSTITTTTTTVMKGHLAWVVICCSLMLHCLEDVTAFSTTTTTTTTTTITRSATRPTAVGLVLSASNLRDAPVESSLSDRGGGSGRRTWRQRPSPAETRSSLPHNPHRTPTATEASMTTMTPLTPPSSSQRRRRQTPTTTTTTTTRTTRPTATTMTTTTRPTTIPRDSLLSNLRRRNRRSNDGVGTFDSSSSNNENNNNNNNKSGSPRQKTQPMPLTGYDAVAIEDYYDRRPFQVIWRLNSLGFPMLGWYFRLLGDKAWGVLDQPQVQRKRGQELRQLLVQSQSVALIKSGQALSLRPDLMRNRIWADELGKLVDAVGSFPDTHAMTIIQDELSDLRPALAAAASSSRRRNNNKQSSTSTGTRKKPRGRLQKMAATDDILSLFEFYNNNRAVASASIGQVYKARIRRGPALEAAIGRREAARWGGRVVAIKVQRPDVEASASLDMYLLRRLAEWLGRVRGGDLVQIADVFGMQLFGELDYVREANNCDRFRELYGDWSDVRVPEACTALTRRRVLVLEWIEGEKGPWNDQDGIDMVKIGLRCSVDQLMNTGVFHADPHRGNLLKTPEGKLAFIDFGMMADIDEEERYGLFGLIIGLQNKDLPLVTENLLKLGFLKDTAQLDQLIPRLRSALRNATGGSGKASDVNFASLQAELDAISRENILRFDIPAFFTIIIRSLTILEGVALSVDSGFKLVRGAYPYVLRQLLSPDQDEMTRTTPAALQTLLVRLLTVNGEEKEIEWARLRDLLRLAQKASKAYDPSTIETDDKAALSRQTIEMFGRFLTSRSGIFLKKPLVHELAEVIDGGASTLEANLFRAMPQIPQLPGMNGPVNSRRMEEMQLMLDTFQEALLAGASTTSGESRSDNAVRMEAILELFREAMAFLQDEQNRQDTGPLLEELQSVSQMVAVEVLEIRGGRAMRTLLGAPASVVAFTTNTNTNNTPTTTTATTTAMTTTSTASRAAAAAA